MTRVVFAAVWLVLGCTGNGVLVEGTGAARDSAPCVDTPYLPAGPLVATVEECPTYPQSCPYRCEPPACAGASGTLYCEDCIDLERYNDGHCSSFRVDGGAFSHACEWSLGRHLWLALAGTGLAATLGCGWGHQYCDPTRYTPRGPTVTSLEECPSFPDSCPVDCTEATPSSCAGTAIHCESCADVQAWMDENSGVGCVYLGVSSAGMVLGCRDHGY